MLLVDTNVLIDVLEDEPEWADWSIGQLRAQSKVHPLAINPIIYAELSLAFSRVEVLDKTIENLGLTILEFSRPTLFLTGNAFVQYRKRSGIAGNVSADSFIGAPASVLGCPLLMRGGIRLTFPV